MMISISDIFTITFSYGLRDLASGICGMSTEKRPSLTPPSSLRKFEKDDFDNFLDEPESDYIVPIEKYLEEIEKENGYFMKLLLMTLPF